MMHRVLRLKPSLPLRAAARQLCSGPELAIAARPRGTKIVATIGPASEEKAPLEACVAAGMNVMRVNFSHATVEEFHLRRNNLRNNPAGENVAIMLDTKGPEIRTGILVGDDMRWTPLPYESGLAYAERSSLDISGAPWPVHAAVESFARLFPRWSVLGVCHNQYVLQKDAAVH